MSALASGLHSLARMPPPRFPLPVLVLLACLAAHAAACEPRPAALPPLQSGDLVFQTSRSRQSAAIQAATHSPLSHVGLVDTAFNLAQVAPEGGRRPAEQRAEAGAG